jgi:hypothetical protein
MKPSHYEFVQLPAFSKRLDESKDPGLLNAIEEELLKNPEAGVLLKGGVRKVRILSASTGRGKRGGFRAWHYFYRIGEKIYLLYLLDKREAQNISKAQEGQMLAALHAALDTA